MKLNDSIAISERAAVTPSWLSEKVAHIRGALQPSAISSLPFQASFLPIPIRPQPYLDIDLCAYALR